MLRVDVFKLTTVDGKAKDVKLGSIAFDGRQFVLAPPDQPLLNHLVHYRLQGTPLEHPVFHDGVRVTPEGDPVGWLKGLSETYGGSYLRCSPAYETDDQDEGEEYEEESC
jgi:hypothetical protein